MAQISAPELQKLVHETSKATVHEMLTQMGVDTKNPLEMQADMMALRELRKMYTDVEVQQDMAHLREWRQNMQRIKTKGMLTVLGITLAGAISMFWMGFKITIGK